MKTTLINSLKTMFNILFLAIMLQGCAQSAKNVNARSQAEKPEIDIQTAVISGNLQAVKQHIEAGTDINEKDQFSGSTPLISASTFNKPEIAKALIDSGADLTIKNNDGSTALHAAAFFCRVEIVQLLIDADADKTLRNNFGATARESVIGPFEEIRPIYEMLQQQLSAFGLQLNMSEVEKTRPVIAMMLQ
ncbi:MAG: ankyrin repeat domain-containing protein [Flavobacteriaceae bacterium]